MRGKYKVEVSRWYIHNKTIEVEASSKGAAKRLALTKINDVVLDLAGPVDYLGGDMTKQK